MMRGAHTCAIAVRAPDGAIRVETEPLGRVYRSSLAKIPFVRGLLVLWDSLALGMRALTFSANVQAGEQERIEGAPMILTLALSLLLGISLFFLLPAGVGYLVEKSLHVPAWWSNVIEGLVRLGLLVGYIWAIGLVPDIRRVYSYHGAEHKTINALEAGADLTPSNVQKFSLIHPRCGTAFLLWVMVIAIFVFAFVGRPEWYWLILSRILLLPVIAGLAYEVIRFAGKHQSNRLLMTLLAPGLWLQRLTTRQPTLDQIEVSIRALRRVVEWEEAETSEQRRLETRVEVMA